MAVNLDRFAQGLPDPQEAEVVCHCFGCGGEIYKGEDVYVVGKDILHADWDCLYRYIDPDFMTVEEALRVEA